MQPWLDPFQITEHLNLAPDDNAHHLLSDYIDAAEAWVSAYVGTPFQDAADPEAEPPPAPQLHACRMLIAHWYENREAVHVSAGSASALPIPFGVYDLLRPYRNWGYDPEEAA